MQYLLSLAGVRNMPKEQKNGKYKGKDVFSMLLPEGLNFELLSKKEKFVIKNGMITEGVVTKSVYGEGNTLFIKITQDYGTETLRKFLSSSSRVADACSTFFGISIGVKDDEVISPETEKARAKLLEETHAKVDALIESYKTRKLEPLLAYTLSSRSRVTIVAELDIARDTAGHLLETHTPKGNSAMLMSLSGARGNLLNFVQMSMFLGQQAPMEGGRIKRGYYSGRVLPHVEPRSIMPKSKGFVEGSFSEGLSPTEMMMHAIGARSSVIHKGLLTPKSGYLQRRLANALQDYYVFSDNSVRDVSNKLIQTVYGGDALDPTKVGFAKFEAKTEIRVAPKPDVEGE